MVSVSQLGYLGIATSDPRAWQELATGILGMQVVPGDDRSTSYLRMDDYHHRLELRAVEVACAAYASVAAEGFVTTDDRG